jgi:hypothetical protein
MIRFQSMPAVLKPPPIGDSLDSPENHVGYERTENFTSPCGAIPDKRQAHAAPARLTLDQWALGDRPRRELRYDFTRSSMDSRPVPLTASTSTRKVTARLPNRGSIS